MQCSEVQKVRFGTHMLVEEADDWWVSVLPILETLLQKWAYITLFFGFSLRFESAAVNGLGKGYIAFFFYTKRYLKQG